MSPTARPSPDAGALAEVERVYREHVQFVWRSARRLGVRDDHVPDVVQEVFIVVAQRLAEFEGRAQLRTWLFSIVANTVRSYRRATFRHLRRIDAAAQAQQTTPAGATEDRSADRMLLLELLDTLDEERRAVYILSELEGMTAPEIAEGLELNVNTVYSRLRRAKEDLRAALEQRLSAEGPRR